MNGEYPVRFAVDYPERELDRVSTAFRIFTVIPIAIVLGTIGGYSARWGTSTTSTTEPRHGRVPAVPTSALTCRRSPT
jgi:hypothetical protein